MNVKSVMSRPVERISIDSSLVGAAKKFSDQNVGSLLVFEEGSPVGVITRNDLVDAVVFRDGDVSDEGVSSHMTKPVISIEASRNIGEVINMFRSRGVKHVVVTEDGRPVGVVTATDIALHCPDWADELLDLRYHEKRVI